MEISIPKRSEERLIAGIKRFQPILKAALDRDANESDTVTIVVDMLADVFGFDKYSEITSEFAIRGTYCDLAIKFDGGNKPSVLVEVKAIGLPTEERYVKQAIDYAANQGVDWVILTNAASWTLYKVTFGKPIGQEEVISLKLFGLDVKDTAQMSALFAMSKGGWAKELPAELNSHKQSLSRFMLGAFLLSEPILETLRREIRKLCDVKVESDQLATILENEVIKREVLEGEKADLCTKKVTRFLAKAKRARSSGTDVPSPSVESGAAVVVTEVAQAAAETVATLTQPPS